jgi:antitoxin (DNA-binding transcriptional repressor) of toxin-antitoxin stability system
MRTLTVSEVKANFMEILPFVQKGERIKISCGRTKKPIAMLIPLNNKNTGRKIGILEGKASFSELNNGKITEEEFLSL